MKKSFFISLSILMCLLSGCISVLNKSQRDTKIFKINISTLEPDQFQDLIDILKKVSESDTLATNRIKALFHIGQALVFHKNPHSDYILALDYFQKYIERSPHSQKKNEVMNWMKLLQHFQESRQLIEELQKNQRNLSDENLRISEIMKNQEKTIEKLKKDIKQLDSLYFKIESKKKKINNHK